MTISVRPRPLLRALIVAGLLALCALVPASLSAPGAQAAACGRVIDGRVGVWTVRSAPAFPAGDRAVRAHAVDPRQPLRQFVSNGVSVMRANDACTWREVFRLPDLPSPGLPASSVTDRVLQVVVHPRAPERVWLVVAVGQDVAGRLQVGPYRPGLPLGPAADQHRDGTQTLVLASRDGGATWDPGPSQPLLGAPGLLAPAPTSPQVLYLPTFAGVHVSLDGARTWQPLPPAATAPAPYPGRPPLDAVSAPDTARVAVDPTSAGRLYGHNATSVRHSQDGGLTWSAYRLPPDYNSGPFVDRTPAEVRRMVVATQRYSTEPVGSLWFLGPGGALEERKIKPGTIGGVPWRAAWHPSRDELVMGTWDRGNGAAFPEVSLYRANSSGEVEDINELGLPPVLGLDVDDFGGYHLHTGGELVSLTTKATAGNPDLEVPQQVEMDPFQYRPPTPPQPAGLTGPTTLRLVPGEDTEVTWALDLPRRPSPLDAYFLIDTSNSFEPDIQALADGMAGVVRTLGRRGIDAHVGLGELGTREARRYTRFADIAPPGTRLQRGFEKLRTGGGYESHLIALHQAATGSGVKGTGGPAVAPGQDPTWRRQSLRTLVVITDVEYVDEDDPEAPTRRQVYDALAARGVRVIGLEVAREGGDDGTPGAYAAAEAADAASTTVPTPARRDLEELASATGSFAPPGGVDCGGNGTTEIAAGAPMVCTTTALRVARISTLAEVLTRVLEAQVDERPVSLRTTGGLEVVGTDPAGLVHPAVDVRADQRLAFTARLRCTTAQAGQVIPWASEALVGREPVATAPTRVECGPPVLGPADPAPGEAPAEGDPVPPVSQQPPPQAALAPPGPPPAATAPIAGTGSASATAPGSTSAPAGAGQAAGHSAGQSAGQSSGATAPGTSAAAAASTEESPELSLASLQMNTRTSPPPLTQPWTLVVAGALTGAAALRHRRARERRATSTVRIRTR